MNLKYAQQYLLSAMQLMKDYDGKLPLAAYLKNHFSVNKKFGSKDRKHIAHLCYAYCRIGHAAARQSSDIRFRIALFLVNENDGGWAGLFDADWLEHWSDDVDARIRFISKQYPDFNTAAIFPCAASLSEQVELDTFSKSHLRQPDVFLRIRPGKYEAVRKKIQASEIPYREISDSCFACNAAVKLDELLMIDRDVVVQDQSSQRMASLLNKVQVDKTKAIQFWDCCAASGGKTILAKDSMAVIDITVSDIRSSILHNLTSRFERAGIKYFQTLVTDLSKAHPQKPAGLFDLIWADVPCSGSGTWGRTPEQLLFFCKLEKGNAAPAGCTDSIAHYTHLQQQIVSNLFSSLAPGGYLLYSTCSVFRAENEDNRDVILSQDLSLKVVDEQYLKGYDQKSDSMYAVLFRKNR